MSARPRHAAGPALVLALAVAGCGGSDEKEGRPIPRAAVSELSQRFDEVQRRYDAGTQDGVTGACNDIDEDSYPAIDSIVASIPPDVDAEVREALVDSISRLRELTSDCLDRAEEQEPVETEPEPEPLPEPEPVPEETVPEETIPEETVPEEPDQGQDGGGGATPPGQGGTPPGQGGTPPGQGGGQFAPGED